ncbi:MAG: hypothetical protein R2710_22535 [Acidimicrobiales bacterium]
MLTAEGRDVQGQVLNPESFVWALGKLRGPDVSYVVTRSAGWEEFLAPDYATDVVLLGDDYLASVRTATFALEQSWAAEGLPRALEAIRPTWRYIAFSLAAIEGRLRLPEEVLLTNREVWQELITGAEPENAASRPVEQLAQLTVLPVDRAIVDCIPTVDRRTGAATGTILLTNGRLIWSETGLVVSSLSWDLCRELSLELQRASYWTSR